MLCIATIILLLKYPTNKTKNRGHSIDTQFHDGAGSVSLSFLHLKVVNAVVMYNHYKITS